MILQTIYHAIYIKSLPHEVSVSELAYAKDDEKKYLNGREYLIIKNDFDYTNKWCINHTRKIGFQFNQIASYGKPGYDYKIYPISILTAIGNGEGGGDYYGKTDKNNKQLDDFDMVGKWNLEKISIEDELPNGYTEIKAPQFFE